MTPMVMVVLGARPQFIKAAVVSRSLAQARGTPYQEVLVHTGQHFDREMSEVFFEQLSLPAPAVNLGIQGGSHGAATGAMLAALEHEMISRAPDAVMVFGDTNSTIAGALAAAKLHIPVVHVEAGLRSYNRRMPEEINRVVTDHLSTLLLCSSAEGDRNLRSEGIDSGVRIVGDTMYDAVLHYSALAPRGSRHRDYAVATIHRAENTDVEPRLRALVEGLAQSPLPVVLPLHPRTRRALDRFELDLPDAVEPIAPVPYVEMLGLIRDSALVLTDSGGLQKEAYFLGKPCVTLRTETEWVELVEMGVNLVVGTDPTAIAKAFEWAAGVTMPDEQPYGDGNAGPRIVEAVGDFLAGL